jgi:hypothetical protein
MQHLLTGLNPPEVPDFVSVYLDDVIVLSRIWPILVIDGVAKAGLKLKPFKYYFVKQYLSHLLTPEGICPNPDSRDYSAPRSMKEV